ncbi:unnamed protein product [Thlaspi arvense]|uniref:GPI-anchored protein LLG1-like domain-containing protein n=1 Tax=Thlaspi arvense TaxID=13288 RepID=A0AAU9T0S4_THLAR|nr:unnamed protein product [Thlaspi arvense]
MELKFSFLLMALLVTLSSSTSISDSVFESQTSVSGRNLLAMKKCEVNFESMNYTGMINQCRGPGFPAKECCSAFKEFACPFVNQINDRSSDCAKTMFSYLNVYGKYPPGLFANECKERKDGIVCPSSPHSPTIIASTAPRFLPLFTSAVTAVLIFLVLA